MKPGVYLVHKDVGGSSFDAVRTFKREAYEAGLKKYPLGHGGTLDPFADGLLLVLAGQATRLMELMHPLPKTYEAELVWGEETDTCDHLGLPVSQGDAGYLTPEKLEAALGAFLGWRDQVPPATCAKKIDGESAYKKAHRGEEVVLPPSRVFLHSAQWLSHDLPRSSRLRITCRGGFYVRSLARDLGRLLGCGAHLCALRRTAIGPWEDPGSGQRIHLQGEALIPWCPARRIDDAELDHLLHGRPIPMGAIEASSWTLPEGFPDPGAPIRALHGDRLVALLQERDGKFWTTANLRGGI
ncbi:tRNA pseudouridine(55) synthase TruB [Holophaga foetida]|uniref:tRNA pseudouridine(55) synthase TruB n=1 Tax=Holophaga foetida TaxID=35839 RepID=UPI000247219D|nr:tRNA pseudouridine(55) synthase TruB [Holophaga foetida]